MLSHFRGNTSNLTADASSVSGWTVVDADLEKFRFPQDLVDINLARFLCEYQPCGRFAFVWTLYFDVKLMGQLYTSRILVIQRITNLNICWDDWFPPWNTNRKNTAESQRGNQNEISIFTNPNSLFNSHWPEGNE